ncbi:MAG: YhcH/YjgK/YiaL family protein [Clostridium sp.]|uniref:YhcH/YjgK/YiaL family protein n=1 Tax=Clostridium sp. TaxID=1506 RepID=UPI003EE5BCCB
MIFGNINNLKNVDEKIVYLIEIAKSEDLLNLPIGKNNIYGDIIFLNRQSKDLSEDGFFEGHKEYLDLHIILEGDEKIGYNLKENLKLVNFNEEEDFIKYEGKEQFFINLKKGDFAVFYPEDAHKVLLKPSSECNHVEKVVLKAKLF